MSYGFTWILWARHAVPLPEARPTVSPIPSSLAPPLAPIPYHLSPIFPRRHTGFFATRPVHQSIQPKQRKKDRYPDWEDEEKHDPPSSVFYLFLESL